MAVHIDYQNGHRNIYISCRTNWGWVDDPTKGIYGMKWDFPERFSEECRGAATVAFRALQEFNVLKHKLFSDSPFVIMADQEEQDRYGNLLGLFYPEYRNDEWVNYMETEADIEYV